MWSILRFTNPFTVKRLPYIGYPPYSTFVGFNIRLSLRETPLRLPDFVAVLFCFFDTTVSLVISFFEILMLTGLLLLCERT